jgi:recombination endonuclease VII
MCCLCYSHLCRVMLADMKTLSQRQRNNIAHWADNPGASSVDKRLYRRYGIAPETVPTKPDRCDICKGKNRKLCLDHCHVSKQFRGWLCNSCNSALGFAADNITILYAMIGYLNRHPQPRQMRNKPAHTPPSGPR